MDNFFTRAASVIRNEHRPPRLYHLYNLILMFFIFSFTGWVWEVIYIGFTEGVVAKRGMLHGPWLPIYGVGGVLILLLLNRFRNNPPLVFLLAVLLCGTIEYNTAVMIEMIFRCRWWDYSTKFMNLNGRICLEGLMMFGVTGTLATCKVGPKLDSALSRIPRKLHTFLNILLSICFVGDIIFSMFIPNIGVGITYDLLTKI